MKELNKAKKIILDNINTIEHASNHEELKRYAQFACGAANALWIVGIFNKEEHNENFKKIKEAENKQKELLK